MSYAKSVSKQIEKFVKGQQNWKGEKVLKFRAKYYLQTYFLKAVLEKDLSNSIWKLCYQHACF